MPELHKNSLASEKDDIQALNHVDWMPMLKYAEELGLGSRKHELIEI